MKRFLISFLYKLETFVKKNPKKVISIYFSTILLAVLLLLLNKTYDVYLKDKISRVWETYFLDFFSLNFVLIFVIITMIFFMVYLVLISISEVSNAKQKNKWFGTTIFFMLYFFIIGIFFIGQNSLQTLDYGLNDENNNLSRTDYNMECDVKDFIRYGEKYECFIYKGIDKEDKVDFANLITNITYSNPEDKSVRYVDVKRNKIQIDLLNKSNVNYILVKVYGRQNGINYSLSSGRAFKVFTDEDIRIEREKFSKSLIFLFSLVFFSIPLMMINLKNLKDK